MIEFISTSCVPADFIGCCKILTLNQIRHYENGVLHREDAPALKAGMSKYWYYKGKCYGYNDEFTIETWKKKVRILKLEIFK